MSKTSFPTWTRFLRIAPILAAAGLVPAGAWAAGDLPTTSTVQLSPSGRVEIATFGAGCFWGVEAAFREVPGVVDAAVGYSGGTTPNPTYKQVCSDKTGHAEVVEVRFDPTRVSYEKLLGTFWEIHNPTTPNRQGPDVGSQYRSIIFYHNEAQKAAAEKSKKALQESGKYKRPIVTEIVGAKPFYRAEEYHQRYLEKQGLASCHVPGS